MMSTCTWLVRRRIGRALLSSEIESMSAVSAACAMGWWDWFEASLRISVSGVLTLCFVGSPVLGGSFAQHVRILVRGRARQVVASVDCEVGRRLLLVGPGPTWKNHCPDGAEREWQCDAGVLAWFSHVAAAVL
eukprot:s87_g27.t1